MMKKLSTYLFLIFFSFQTLSLADDIRDFQIEGMSVGDSLLDYFSEEKIEEEKNSEYVYRYKDNRFIILGVGYGSAFPLSKSQKLEVYDEVGVVIKPNDKSYKIHGLTGTNFYIDNIKDCYDTEKKISKKKKFYVVGNAKNFAFKLFKHKKSNNKIIFIGNIKFIPNLLACIDFAKNVLKKINLKYPEIKFHVIGDIRYFDRLFLSKYKNVVIHGKVNNLKNVIKNSICGLCNVKISTGFQNKTLSYMSYGIPAILSINSFSNASFKKNKEVLVFKNDGELIKNIFYLIENKKAANQLSINSQIIIKKKYNRNKVLSKYGEII